MCKLNYFEVLCNISLKANLPEDGHDRWPKYVGSYAVCNKIHLRYLCMQLLVTIFITNHQYMTMNL